ncbi:MAG: SH3 domain-containing protein [Chloroflexales bacterium]|nr:SH3 domain-containing protein [Chloroflexales bacterium]
MDRSALRRRNLTRNLMGSLVMVGLVIIVALASYLAVNTVAGGIAGLPRPGVPGLPELPGGDSGGPLGWIGGLFGGDEEIFIVNIAEGLNIRREPDASDASNVIEVVPNGTPVHKLEGPRVEGNIPWLRVRVEVDGRQLEGWMSMNYLMPKQ